MTENRLKDTDTFLPGIRDHDVIRMEVAKTSRSLRFAGLVAIIIAGISFGFSLYMFIHSLVCDIPFSYRLPSLQLASPVLIITSLCRLVLGISMVVAAAGANEYLKGDYLDGLERFHSRMKTFSLVWFLTLAATVVVDLLMLVLDVPGMSGITPGI
ncbi:hypothetical protein GF359_07560 [candidate division WOR-3 bacterium]|uniref:Uncharacterized protein n=1 Tax=candidate division WOR-3 bacterium TaxID=2052148 RepID=A0A9D5KA37_UNCW3|nr:hypothetical protein [candidate division WOR-3 bacterium]MBD3365057.1 hypothetical protein [candidate division WOR-3 bacterium]